MDEFEATQIMEMSDNDDSDDCNAEKEEQVLAHFVRVLPCVVLSISVVSLVLTAIPTLAGRPRGEGRH